jgi:hypothetical protein
MSAFMDDTALTLAIRTLQHGLNSLHPGAVAIDSRLPVIKFPEPYTQLVPLGRNFWMRFSNGYVRDHELKERVKIWFEASCLDTPLLATGLPDADDLHDVLLDEFPCMEIDDAPYLEAPVITGLVPGNVYKIPQGDWDQFIGGTIPISNMVTLITDVVHGWNCNE